MKWFKADTKNPEIENPRKKEEAAAEEQGITRRRNADTKSWAERDPKLHDFYHSYDPYKTTILDVEDFERYKKKMGDDYDLIDPKLNYYQIDLSNRGELIMPVILEFEYTDGSKEVQRIPAEHLEAERPQREQGLRYREGADTSGARSIPRSSGC